MVRVFGVPRVFCKRDSFTAPAPDYLIFCPPVNAAVFIVVTDIFSVNYVMICRSLTFGTINKDRAAFLAHRNSSSLYDCRVRRPSVESISRRTSRKKTCVDEGTWTGGWPSLPMAHPHNGCPILRGFFAKGGWQTDRTMGFAFTACVPEPRSSPTFVYPHRPRLVHKIEARCSPRGMTSIMLPAASWPTLAKSARMGHPRSDMGKENSRVN